MLIVYITENSSNFEQWNGIGLCNLFLLDGAHKFKAEQQILAKHETFYNRETYNSLILDNVSRLRMLA